MTSNPAPSSSAPVFVDEWYPTPQLQALVDLLTEVLDAEIPGELVEIGCWEGRSTVGLAVISASLGRALHAVDWWLGNVDEGNDHPSVMAARSRDVYSIFKHNVAPYPHVKIHRQEGGQFLKDLCPAGEPAIAFVHLDAGHTYGATKALIDLAIPRLAPGAIICGDDFVNAHIGRSDLGGGVERAVRESFGMDFVADGNLWVSRIPR